MLALNGCYAQSLVQVDYPHVQLVVRNCDLCDHPTRERVFFVMCAYGLGMTTVLLCWSAVIEISVVDHLVAAVPMPFA